MRQERESTTFRYLTVILLIGLLGTAGCSVTHDQTVHQATNGQVYQEGQFTDIAILHGFDTAFQTQASSFEQSTVKVSQPVDPVPTPYTRAHSYDTAELSADWHSQVGWTLVLDGNYSGAESAYREALRQNHEFAGAHLGLGIALLMQGNRAQAISAYKKALELRPDYPAALVHLGYIYIDGLNGTRNFTKARKLFQQASKQGDPFAMLALVDLNARQGMKRAKG